MHVELTERWWTYLEISNELLRHIAANGLARVECMLLGNGSVQCNGQTWSRQFDFDLFVLVTFGQINQFEVALEWGGR